MTDVGQPSDLTPRELLVLDALAPHRGRAAAIHKEALAEMVGMEVRKVRIVIAHLIERHNQPIGSASQAPAGYFLIETAEEAEQAAQELKARIIQLAKRLAKLKQNTPADCLDQLRIDLQEVA